MATPRTPREDLQRRNAGLPPQQAANPTPSSDRDTQQLHPRGVAGDTLDSGMFANLFFVFPNEFFVFPNLFY